MSTMSTTNKKSGGPAGQAGPQAPGRSAAGPDRIRKRSYELYRARNGGPGNDVSDWLQAERELNGAARGDRQGTREPPELLAKIRGETLMQSGEVD